MEGYFRQIDLKEVGIGDKFVHQGEWFALIYNDQEVMVGLTVRDFEGSRRASSFGIEQKVLIEMDPSQLNLNLKEDEQDI